MTDRKKPGVAFWATVTMSLPVLYVLSFAPLLWLDANDYIADESLFWDAGRIYSIPIRAAYEIGPDPVRDELNSGEFSYRQESLPRPAIVRANRTVAYGRNRVRSSGVGRRQVSFLPNQR